MLSKWPVAGLIAGIVLFFWGAITHMAFNIESYIKPVPNEAAFLTLVQANLPEPGLYFFPNEMDPARMEERVKTAPRGLLTYTPAGTPFSMGRSLGMQAVSDILAALIAAFLFSMAAPALKSAAERIVFTAVLGLFAVAAIQIPYWNWYGFPAASIGTAVIEEGIGGVLAGVVFARLLK